MNDTNKLTVKDCEKTIAALSTSQMKDSLMARSLMNMHQQLADTMRENEKLRDALSAIEGISNEDYKTGGFLTGEIPVNWAELALCDAKTLAHAELDDQQHKHSGDIPTIRIVDKIQSNRGYLPGDYDNAMVPSGEPTKVCENLSKNLDDYCKNGQCQCKNHQSKTSGDAYPPDFVEALKHASALEYTAADDERNKEGVGLIKVVKHLIKVVKQSNET